MELLVSCVIVVEEVGEKVEVVVFCLNCVMISFSILGERVLMIENVVKVSSLFMIIGCILIWLLSVLNSGFSSILVRLYSVRVKLKVSSVYLMFLVLVLSVVVMLCVLKVVVNLVRYRGVRCGCGEEVIFDFDRLVVFGCFCICFLGDVCGLDFVVWWRDVCFVYLYVDGV